MAVEVVVSVIARDRPGLVQMIAEAVTAHGGNWIDSSMARLGGEFAGIVRVDVPAEQVSALEAALDRLKLEGLVITLKRSDGVVAPKGRVAMLELTGTDHPGIVRDIAAALARRGVSIDDLETRVFPSSMSGGPMFHAKARIILPEGVEAAELDEEFDRIGRDIMVDVDVRDAG